MQKYNLKKLATSGVADLIPYQPGLAAQQLMRQYQLTHVIKLASNENPLGPSPLVTERLQQISPQHIARYPESNANDLKNSLSDALSVSANHITIGNGSNEILEIIARALITEGDGITFSQYGFAVYPLIAQAMGARAHIAPAENFAHNSRALIEAIKPNTKIVFIANPNNPTGTWLHQDDLIQILERINKEVVVVMDEAYYDFVQVSGYPDSIALLKAYPNLVVVRTFSKAYGLAGLRVGYAIAHPELTDLFNRVRQPFNSNVFALIAAETALADQEHIAKSVQLVIQERDKITTALNALGLIVIPSIGNFVTVAFSKPGREIYEQLLQRGLILRPLDNYNMRDYLRISIGLPQENDTLLTVLSELKYQGMLSG